MWLTLYKVPFPCDYVRNLLCQLQWAIFILQDVAARGLDLPRVSWIIQVEKCYALQWNVPYRSLTSVFDRPFSFQCASDSNEIRGLSWRECHSDCRHFKLLSLATWLHKRDVIPFNGGKFSWWACVAFRQLHFLSDNQTDLRRGFYLYFGREKECILECPFP